MIDVGIFGPMAGKRSSPRQIARSERRALIVQRSYALEDELAERVARARETTDEEEATNG